MAAVTDEEKDPPPPPPPEFYEPLPDPVVPDIRESPKPPREKPPVERPTKEVTGD